MERKRYLTKAWFHKNSCDGLFWNCELPFFSLYQIPPVKQYILLGCSLQKPYKLSYTFLKNCIKRPSCNTNPIPSFHQSASNILKHDSLSFLLLLLPSMWSSLTISRLSRSDVEAWRGMSYIE